MLLRPPSSPSFLAALLRAAAPQDGEIFVDLGSGVGKAVFAAGALYPRLKKAVGVEYLPGLHQKAGQYQAKYRRLGGAPAEFVNADFTSPKVSMLPGEYLGVTLVYDSS